MFFSENISKSTEKPTEYRVTSLDIKFICLDQNSKGMTILVKCFWLSLLNLILLSSKAKAVILL